MSRILTCALLFVLGASAASAQLVPFWIPDDGCTLVRNPHGSFVYYFRGQQQLRLIRAVDEGFEDVKVMNHVWVTESTLGKSSDVYPGMETATFDYDPPLIVLDLPLETGKTWTSQSVRTTEDFPSAPKTHILTCTVMGVPMVSTVLGLMEVYEVHETEEVVGIGVTTRTRYLNWQYGDVYGLLETEECAPLPVESVSWSAIKELYR